MARVLMMKIAPYGGMCKTGKFHADLAMHRISPPIDLDSESLARQMLCKEDFSGVKKIISSPQLRGIQTAKLISRLFLPGIKIEEESSIDEIKFSLDEIKEGEYSSTIARKKFMSDFISGKLPEHQGQIRKRVLMGLSFKNALLVSHTFFIKVAETYCMEPALFDSPHLLSRHFNPDRRLYDHLQIVKLRLPHLLKHKSF